MLHINLNKASGIVIAEPDGKLSKEDFVEAAKLIDPYIEETGKLNGIIIHTQSFPGWESFGAMVKHFKFVKNHHQCISHVAIVTDSKIGNTAEHIGSHFVKAEVKSFGYDEIEQAKEWILG
ncbi:MAG: STAS/SEC14 domain-containing protein [Kiritimatiellae bacterium]|jgi:hypothetical protein|nr:STAS/SEC14 domain-containing protein [Kiritimatiellia bacterium]